MVDTNRPPDAAPIRVPNRAPQHRNDEYEEEGFDLLVQMQRDHFWYTGRHRLILEALRREIAKSVGVGAKLRAIDLGGGCGGWIEYLHAHENSMFQELALGDSSLRALALAEPVVGSYATRYQIDLLDLPWDEEWDVIFLLDVLEHIPAQETALSQIKRSLRPGGLLVVTTPALACFWTYNDELAHHQRRYCRADFAGLAATLDLTLLRTNYFMFFLAPFLWLHRVLVKPPVAASSEQLRAHVVRTHRIPSPLLNGILNRILTLEALLVNRIRLPFGTSILAIYKKK